jgi:A-macroglobulin complement component/carboxypeptidase family protein/alpha-2-macroglobulin family protein
VKPRSFARIAATVGAAAAAAVLMGDAHAAATGAVEGSVIDQVTSQVVAAGKLRVAITCGAVHRSAAVDAHGHFAIGDLPEGSCTLTASGPGYVAATIAVTVTGGSIATLLVGVTSQDYADKLRKQQEQQMRLFRDRGMRAGAGAGGPRPVPGRVLKHMAPPEAAEALEPAPAPMAAPPPRLAPPPPPAAPAPPPAKTPAPPANAAAVKAAPPPAEAAKVAAPRPVPAAAQAVAPPPPRPQSPVVGKLAAPAATVAHGRGMRLDAKDIDARILAGKKRIALRGNGDFALAQPDNRWAVVRVFPVPQYTRAYDGPRSDFRETVYWNPSVETSAAGDAEVAFVVSDAVTAFRATAEGFSAAGLPGGGQATFQSKLPLTLDAHVPVEVTSGDTVRLPITLTNETDEPIDATLAAQFGSAFKLAGQPGGAIHLRAHDKQSLIFPLDVVATDGNADVAIKLTGRGLADEIKRTIRVVPRGFPIELAASGTAHGGSPARHTLDLTGALPGTLHASVTMFPSPVAAMTQGMAGMIREPGGCFEQTSSANYPNIMILGYLNSSDGADPALVARTQSVLDHGYKLLTGYETTEKGYEWFGHTPGHEALTAYGLMEFADMAKVYDVDRKMVERTADWLMSRRDGQGGFTRSSEALDSFGRASPTTTNAYIMWALSEAHRSTALARELAAQKALGTDTRDPYLLALATSTNLAAAPRADETTAMVKKLAALQARDGSFPGGKESITMSGGESLTIETTALAVLALIKASPASEYEAQIRGGVDWLNARRGGYGAWGNTQSTILGLKALTAYSEHARQMAAPGVATLIINGHDAGTIRFDKGRRDALVWNDIAGKLGPGKNTVELRLDSTAQLPYTISVDYRSAQPQSSPATKLAVTTQLLRTQARMGEGVTLRAHVENTTAAGIPMTLVRIGIPGGLVTQTWQLKELRDKHLIDFYETRPREVILYWRALPPSARKDVDLNLVAAVPGSYEAPASSAYLYYTAEDKAWTKPVAITIDR